MIHTSVAPLVRPGGGSTHRRVGVAGIYQRVERQPAPVSFG